MSYNYGIKINKKIPDEFYNLQEKYNEIKKRHEELIKRYRAVSKENEQIKRRLSNAEKQNERLVAEIKFLKLPNGLKQYVKDLKTIKSPFAMRELLEKNRTKLINKLDKIIDRKLDKIIDKKIDKILNKKLNKGKF